MGNKTVKASYSFDLEGSILYWGVLILVWVLLSVVTVGIAFPFVGAYIVKTFLFNLNISKQEKIYDDQEEEDKIRELQKEREESLRNQRD